MGKRANGEGCIYQRSDGRWTAIITLDNGKRKYYYFKTQKEAVKAAQRANIARDQGMLTSSADPFLGDFLTAWLEDTVQYQVKPRTYIRYRELITIHVLPTLGKVKLQKLTPQHLLRLYKLKWEEGLAPGTVRNVHRVLHTALNEAMRWDLVARNVCKAVKGPRVPRKEMQALAPEQAKRFLEAIRDDALEALYVLALTTGMRLGELLGLKWEDLDLAHHTLAVRRTLVRVPHQGFEASEPKTARSRRPVYLTDLAVAALKRHHHRQKEARLRAGPAWDEQGWIFCNGVGRPIENTNLLQRSFRPLLAKAGLPTIRFHDLRHSTATILLSLGVPAKVVQEMLGHSQISLTLDTYSHVLPSMQWEAVSKLNELLAEHG